METLDTRIASETERVSRERELRAALPLQREKLTEQTHLVNRVEACLDEVSEQLNSLQSLGLGSLIDSLFGGKQKKIDECRTMAAEYETQLTGASGELAEVERQFAAIEAELAELTGAEASLQALLDEKAETILASNDARSDELRRVTHEHDNARAVLAKIEKSTEAGRQLLKHLESLDRAVRIARGKSRLAGRAMGVVGKMVRSAVVGIGPKSVLRYVHDGLRRFSEEVGELPLTDHPDEQDLMRIRAELEVFGVRLASELSGLTSWDQIATLPVERDVRAALHHLKSMSANLKPTLEAYERERAAIIAAA